MSITSRFSLPIISQYGLVINLNKCQFGVSTINFLGHCIGSAGVPPQEDHVEAISNLPAPTNKISLQEYLGLINLTLAFICIEQKSSICCSSSSKERTLLRYRHLHVMSHSPKVKRAFQTPILQYLHQSLLLPRMLLLMLWWNNNFMANGF